MNRQQVKQKGMEIQDQAKEKVINALREAKDTKEIANNIQGEQAEQRNRIEYIEDMEGSMESTLKRVKGQIRYFVRHFMTDKIIIALIILVDLGIIAVVIFKVFKKSSVNADQIATSANTTST